jgi:hypothetical protein
MAKRKMTNNNIPNTTQKTKDRETRTPPKHWGWTQVLWKGERFLLLWWHLLRYSSYKSCDKSWMRKGPRSTYERRNTDIPIKVNLVMVATVKLLEWLLRFSWTMRNKYISMSADHGQQLVSFITCGCSCESSAPFFIIYKAGREPRRIGDRVVWVVR